VTLYIWKTNQTSWFIQVGQIKITNKMDTILEPNSVYTFTTTQGQGKAKNGRIIPTSAPFPFPYSDNFENYHVENTVRYFEDEGGSFNAALSPTSGMAFKQVVTQKPISWVYWEDPWTEPEPVTILGNYNWTDYRVRVDVYIPSKPVTQLSYVAVYTRISTYYTFNSSWIPGYGLQLYPVNNSYQIVKGNSTGNGVPKQILSSGRAPITTDRWYTVEVKVSGNAITASINGFLLTPTPVIDSTFGSGMVGLGSGYNYAYFDNFYVGP